MLRNRAFWKAGMVVVAGLLGLAACGDDDGDRATAPGDSSTDGSVEVADASGRLAELLEGLPQVRATALALGHEVPS